MAGHPVLLQGGARDGEVHVLEQDSGVLAFHADEDTESSGRPDEDYLLTEQWRDLSDGRRVQIAEMRPPGDAGAEGG